MNDDKIFITFEGVPAIQANELAEELRQALLNAAVKVDKHGVIEVESVPAPNQAGCEGELFWHFTAHLTAAAILQHSLNDTALAVATAEALLFVVNKVHAVIKIKCPEGLELEVKQTFSREEIKKIADWLHKCMQNLAKKHDDESKK